MIEVRRTTLADWRTWKHMRLTALRSAPTAYGETYEKAAGADEYYWQRWWLERTDDVAMRAMAFADGEPAGQIACIQWRGPEAPPTLIAMWVEERFRGMGVADALVEEVLAWAREYGYQQVELGVTEGNDTARKLYLRHGFEPTGEWEDLISSPGLRIEQMMRTI